MPIVSRGDDEDEQQSMAGAGAPPWADVEFDPRDPDQVKVHYNLTGWSFEQRAELAETLAERSVPHAWEGEELVVPEQIEADVDALFDELEAEIGPFPVPLLDDESGELQITEFELDEWPLADIELLQRSLAEAEIPHRWAGRTLQVDSAAEHTVDELLDAIEAGELASLDESAEAPDGALHDLYVHADRLVRDGADSTSRKAIIDLVGRLTPDAPPFGLAGGAWITIMERAVAVEVSIADGAELLDVSNLAEQLRTVCRPYV